MHNRLYHLTETKGWLCSEQAGFRNLRNFLSNRTARVQTTWGDSASLRQGLLQGVVRSPLMFLLYIDNLRSVVPETARVSLFEGEVSIISNHHNKQVAKKELQRAVSVVAEWNTSKKMVLNADKCKLAFFTTSYHEATCQQHPPSPQPSKRATALAYGKIYRLPPEDKS